MFVCCKGATVYLARHGDKEEEDDEDSNYQKSESDGQMEGGQFEEDTDTQ